MPGNVRKAQIVNSNESPIGMRKCFLHVGLPKTGTSTLQKHLFPHHRQIDYFGKYTGDAGKRKLRGCRDKEVYAFMNELFWKNPSCPNLDVCRHLYNHAILPSFDERKIPVFSWENLLAIPPCVRPVCVRNFYSILGACKIILTIRQPYKFLEAAYFQYVKRQWIGQDAGWGKRPRILPFEPWLESNLMSEESHLTYAESVSSCVDILGKENVGVFVFEELIEDESRYIRSMCHFIGIDPEEGVLLATGRHENKRFTVETMNRINDIQGSLLRSFRVRFTSIRQRRKILGIMAGGAASNPSPARVEIPEKFHRLIAERTCEGNRWLADNWNLPLERHGYPL